MTTINFVTTTLIIAFIISIVFIVGYGISLKKNCNKVSNEQDLICDELGDIKIICK